jgi:hypothetical protein
MGAQDCVLQLESGAVHVPLPVADIGFHHAIQNRAQLSHL